MIPDEVVRLLADYILLFEENQRLKKEVRSRRNQADNWRKKCHAVKRLRKADAPLVKKGEQAEQEEHFAEVAKEE